MVEHPDLGWNGLYSYLAARNEEKRIEIYCWDLVWKLVSARFSGDIPMPSEIWKDKRRADKRTANQIISDVINGLGGG